MNTIFSFDSDQLPPMGQVGGKALALMQMTAAGMPVPPGFVLAVKFFEPWNIILQQSPLWENMLDASGEEVKRIAKELQHLCADLQFTEQQKIELENMLDKFRQVNHGYLYAVRSSSPEEDLEGASFAGGYETTLGVKVDHIEAAIRHSYASSFDERIFLYKKERGFRLDQSRIAVVVQQQVNAESAGVAFSLNPLNNCFDEAVINANHGLGESVVSGDADPDLFVVDKIQNKIIETRIGSKQTMIRLNGAGGTDKLNRASQSEASITPAQVLAVTELLGRVESYYQNPVDIEWAIAGEQLYLLQARPITTYLPLPEELITAPGEPKRLYANSTLIEQGLSEPLSVLGTEFLGYVLKQVSGPIAQDAIGLEGTAFTVGGGYYMNISYALMLGMGKAALAPGSFGDLRVTAILDSIDMRQYLAGDLPEKLKNNRRKMIFTALPMIKSVLAAYLRPHEILRKCQEILPQENKRFEKYTGEGRTFKEQAGEISELLQFFYSEYGIPMILAGQIAMQRIKSLFKQDAALVQDHLINLGVALPGNKTTEMGELMYALAASEEIRRYEIAVDFLADLQAGKLSKEFSQAWQHFMAEFGMRCPAEIDPATSRPKEQQELFFVQLKTMSLSIQRDSQSRSFFEEARAKRETAYQSLYQLALKKGKHQARKFEKYYQTWVSFGGYRETPKHYVIKVIDLFRQRALEIAQIFVAQGRLDQPEQIFNLTIEDIDQAQIDPSLDLRALAHERTLLINKIKRSHLVARVFDSRGKIYFPPRKSSSDSEWSGVPISPGVVKGRVKVLHHANEKPLLPGEILVARATDPGWTPLFINAKGIILEIGGALQHGAVVAREYGIPCVSGLDDATTKLADGQMVEVDGSNGVVRILD